MNIKNLQLSDEADADQIEIRDVTFALTSSEWHANLIECQSQLEKLNIYMLINKNSEKMKNYAQKKIEECKE